MDGDAPASANVAAVLARRAETFGWRARPLFRAREATYTHGDVHDAAARAAAVLHAAGVRRGHRVLIALPDSIAFAAALLGTLRLGALAILTGPEQPAEAHAYVLADSGPAVVVCPSELAGRFTGVHVLTADDLGDEPAHVPEPEHLPPDAPAYVQYTSGTTGPPKGVVHRHADPMAYFQALALGALGVQPDDLLFSVAKACYPYGLGNTIFFPMFCGASSILWPDQATPEGVVEQVRRYGPSLLFTFPYVYARLVDHLHRRPEDRLAFAELRAAASAGEPLLPALADRIAEALGCPVLDGLGSTEVGHTFVSNTVTKRRPGSVGVVLDPYEIDVRTPSGTRARPGERGVLHVRGPSVTRGYLGGPERTGDWLDTGDLVHVDSGGFVHHHGRMADTGTVAGIPVAPVDIERVLGRHPAVAEVAVVRMEGRDRLRAFVVTAAGADPTPALEADLIALAASELPALVVPGEITFMTGLPRSPGGKLRRAALTPYR